MTELIKQYEKDIELIRGRLTELKAHRSADCEGSLRDRIELLQTEMYELMYTAALMRREAGPKPVNPSAAALMLAQRVTGDAAC